MSLKLRGYKESFLIGLISSCEECNTNDKEGQARKNDKRWRIIEMQFGEYLSEHPTLKIILKLH